MASFVVYEIQEVTRFVKFAYHIEADDALQALTIAQDGSPDCPGPNSIGEYGADPDFGKSGWSVAAGDSIDEDAKWDEAWEELEKERMYCP